jgi:hypothetical protein
MRAKPREVEPGTQITLGFDGSDVDDWTGFRARRATATSSRRRSRMAADDLGPRRSTAARSPAPRSATGWPTSSSTSTSFALYFDPPYWESECDAWAEEHGEKVIRWYTKRPTQMHAAAERLYVDLGKTDSRSGMTAATFTQRITSTPPTRPRGRPLTLRAATSSASREMAERSTWRSLRSSLMRLGAT